MVGSVNKVILLGNLGRDPEIRSMQSGSKMATFSMATSKRWKDKTTNEQRDKTSWHNVVVFGDGLVNIIERFVKKGSKIYIEGELQTRKWQDQEGNDKYTTEVILQGYNCNLTLLDTRNQNTEDLSTDENQSSEVSISNNTKESISSSKEEIDDDIPF